MSGTKSIVVLQGKRVGASGGLAAYPWLLTSRLQEKEPCKPPSSVHAGESRQMEDYHSAPNACSRQ